MFRYPTPTEPSRAGYAIAGDRFAILVAPGIDAGLVAGLWNAAAAENAFLEDVLSVFVAGGVHALPSFAVVEFSGGSPLQLRVAVRGDAAILTPTSIVAGREARTWTETSVDADGIRLTLRPDEGTDEPIRDALPLGLGVTRADDLAWGRPVSGAPLSQPSAPDRRSVAAPRTAAGVRTADDLPSVPDLRAFADLPDDVDVLETLAVDRSLFARPLDDDIELPAFLSDDSGSIDLPDDRTLFGGRRAAPAPAPAASYVLRVTPGRDLPLDRPVVLGRGPRPARHPGARLEAVPSPAKEVSGAHLEVRLDGDHLVAQDLDSTNGTIVRPRGAEAVLLRGGASVRVPVGTVFDLGDGVTARFESGASPESASPQSPSSPPRRGR
ncbi:MULTISPECIES: FHA domain-containing protein [unclassified Microbacterium]|uniref:FHA domain-containing protein n=1 Tax=unclassified Microbacterium TaxID=2609290 RepID=UPI003864A81B